MLQTLHPLPDHAKGFLYRYQPPTSYHIRDWTGTDRVIEAPAPLAAAELRFRCVSSPSTAAFDQGYDLLLPHKFMPWAIRFLTLPLRPAFESIYRSLTTEAEREELADYVARSPRVDPRSRIPNSRTSVSLPTILAPFPDDFAQNSIHLGICDPQAYYRRNFDMRFYRGSRSTNGAGTGFSGTALCRFEPFRWSSGGIAVGIRLLRWLKPPNTTDRVVQVEGQFLRRFAADGSLGRLSSMRLQTFPIDSQRLLLEAFPNPEQVEDHPGPRSRGMLIQLLLSPNVCSPDSLFSWLDKTCQRQSQNHLVLLTTSSTAFNLAISRKLNIRRPLICWRRCCARLSTTTCRQCPFPSILCTLMTRVLPPVLDSTTCRWTLYPLKRPSEYE